jgi:PPOX class probable F420-dependent enzyme
MELTKALEFARPLRQGVLTTVRRDGRPQISNIVYALDDRGTARISVTAGRAKTKNLQRDPRSSLYVCADNFWAYAVLEGDAELTPVAADPHDATVEALVALYRSLSGEHPDWDDYRRAMVADQRLVVSITPTRAYGMLPDGRVAAAQPSAKELRGTGGGGSGVSAARRTSPGS